MARQLVEFSSNGLYCPVADVYIDPWKPVDRAIITHAHSDHARMGNKWYLAHKDSVPVLRHRLGEFIDIAAAEYGEIFDMNGVTISLHPAGHIVGSAQIRLEYKGEVWVVSGDYKLEDDGLCQPFESVPCDVFITESTFGLPIFNWRSQQDVFDEINQWWMGNVIQKRNSILVGYSLGKAQRLLMHLDGGIGPIYAHQSIENINKILRQQGYPIPSVLPMEQWIQEKPSQAALIMAPPSALHTPWMQRFEPASIGIASGWMSLRGARRRQSVDRGFILSDHADWPQLQKAVKACGAKKVFVTHGYSSCFSRWLNEQGIESNEVMTHFEGEMEEMDDTAQDRVAS